MAIAAQISLALLSDDRARQFQTALFNRTVIGQAQGMLMQRYQLDPAQAFAVLKRVSQRENRKLREIAVQIVTKGIDAAGM